MRGSSVLLIYVVALVVIVLLFRSQRRKQRAQQDVRSSVTPGTEVMTTAGLYGTIVEVLEDGSIVLEAAPGVHLRFDKRAIARVIEAGPDEDETDEDETDEDDDVAEHDSTADDNAPTVEADPHPGAHPGDPGR